MPKREEQPELTFVAVSMVALERNPKANGLSIFLSSSDESWQDPASSQQMTFQKNGSRFSGKFFMYNIEA